MKTNYVFYTTHKFVLGIEVFNCNCKFGNGGQSTQQQPCIEVLLIKVYMHKGVHEKPFMTSGYGYLHKN